MPPYSVIEKMLKPVTPALRNYMACMRFYTRLKIPVQRFEIDAFAPFRLENAAEMLPLAGATIGLIGGAALAFGLAMHLPLMVTSIISVAALVLTTGAMHEDGVADCADGFGGGASLARKLEIMRDSRIGTFGATALFLTLALRVGLIAGLAQYGLWRALLILVGAGAVSRIAGLVPLLLLSPARSDGVGAGVGKPKPATLQRASILTLTILLLPLLGGQELTPLLVGFGGALFAAYAVAKLAAQQIGGQTGDVAGLAQQAAEIAFMLVLSSK